jgi:1,4-alpha-glucan branching enzyme
MAPFNLHDPHAFLGLHTQGAKKILRVLRKPAPSIFIELFGKKVELKAQDGLFEIDVPEKTTLQDYKVYYEDGRLEHDPYAFFSTFGEMDAFLFNKGVHYKLYDVMGGRLCTHQGVSGARFAVWAPHARGVSLVGDFNHWDGTLNPMRSMGASGVWELFVPGLKEGERYKFAIHTREGQTLLKADPYAYFSELRPSTASVLFNVNRHEWSDHTWMKNRADKKSKMLIYEVHLGSWKKGLNYQQLALELSAYCKEMGFTHVELLPVAEHPLDESWGYQVTGFYAITSRFGTPEDFQCFVDHFHTEGLGVIVDWVPGHFPFDDFSLAKFDGSCLYEHADPRQGFHPHWNTAIFNYGRKEVSNFLIANALFWCEKMHVDGLRVDAVASMLYLDYGRKEGEWIPNKWGGNENLEAIEFMKHLNSIVHQYFPTVVVFAEESTSFPGVSTKVEWEGLGFDFKWNMGWMNDTLRYFSKEAVHRKFHQNDLTFGLVYAFTERYVLVLSHDEVVHGKGSLLAKMPGDDWQKFANVRLLYSYMMCQPGKKLLFMGGEIGSWGEWRCKEELEWSLLQYERHKQLKRCFKELNFFYQNHASLWEKDCAPSCFEWIDFQDSANSVLSYLRKSSQEKIVCVHNFTPNYFKNYMIRYPVSEVSEIFNTDGEEFGGSGKINCSIHRNLDPEGRCIGFTIELAPLATMIFKVDR